MRLVRTASAAAVGVALLAGCSDGGQANQTLPSASSSAAETSDSLPPLGPPDLPMPPEAREQTEAGAQVFLRYYMDVYTAAQATMDPSYMAGLSQACETCDRLITNIRDDAGAGYTYDGGVVTVTDVSAPAIRQDRAELAFSMTQAALTVRDSFGSAIPDLSAPAAVLQCGAIASWSPSQVSWVLTQWDVN
jgi:hypothetical protein